MPVGNGEAVLQSELMVDRGDLLAVGEGEIDDIADVAVFRILEIG